MKIDFTSQECVQKIKKQDTIIFGKLVENYSQHLFLAAKGLGLSDFDAEEMSSKTWETFFEIAPRFEGKSHVRTFLFGIFYNKIREFKRNIFKEQLKDPIEDVLESRFALDGHWGSAYNIPDQNLENAQYYKNFLLVLTSCLDGLPSMQKQAFIHKHIFENEGSEICEFFDIEAANLRQLLVRSKIRLRECLEKKEYGIGNIQGES